MTKATPPRRRTALVDNEGTHPRRHRPGLHRSRQTGYSRAIPSTTPSKFHGVESDIQSVGEFIRLCTTRYGRWTSPKFLAGESYGTTRAAGLAGYLQERHGLLPQRHHADLVHPQLPDASASTPATTCRTSLFLPDLHRHGLVPQAPARRPAGATCRSRRAPKPKRFALGDYAPALMQGDRLTADERARCRAEARALHRPLAGLHRAAPTCASTSIASTRSCCATSAARSGRLDSRFTGIDRDAAGERPEFDPR